MHAFHRWLLIPPHAQVSGMGGLNALQNHSLGVLSGFYLTGLLLYSFIPSFVCFTPWFDLDAFDKGKYCEIQICRENKKTKEMHDFCLKAKIRHF